MLTKCELWYSVFPIILKYVLMMVAISKQHIICQVDYNRKLNIGSVLVNIGFGIKGNFTHSCGEALCTGWEAHFLGNALCKTNSIQILRFMGSSRKLFKAIKEVVVSDLRSHKVSDWEAIREA